MEQQKTTTEHPSNVPPMRMCVMNTANQYSKRLQLKIALANFKYSPINKIIYDYKNLGFNEESTENIDNMIFISEIDGRDKYSEWYFECTGIIVSAIDKKTGKQISFMTHQHTTALADKPELRKKFFLALEKKMNQLKDMAKEGTIDIAIFGGKKNPKNKKAYEYMIPKISIFLKKVSGSTPTIMQGANPTDNYNSVYYETSKKRLYSLRPKKSHGTKAEEPYTIDETG